MIAFIPIVLMEYCQASAVGLCKVGGHGDVTEFIFDLSAIHQIFGEVFCVLTALHRVVTVTTMTVVLPLPHNILVESVPFPPKQIFVLFWSIGGTEDPPKNGELVAVKRSARVPCEGYKAFSGSSPVTILARAFRLSAHSRGSSEALLSLHRTKKGERGRPNCNAILTRPSYCRELCSTMLMNGMSSDTCHIYTSIALLLIHFRLACVLCYLIFLAFILYTMNNQCLFCAWMWDTNTGPTFAMKVVDLTQYSSLFSVIFCQHTHSGTTN